MRSLEGHESRETQVEALDGTPLAATWWVPDQAPVQTTVVAPAMGVPRGFYDRIAAHLADRGHRVLSFDYRGVGDSAPDPVRRSDARLLDWGRLDLPGAIESAAHEAQAGSVALLGHSVAGQVLGLAPNKDLVERATLVASVKGHWRLWSGAQRLAIAGLAFALVPALSRLFGYFPARLGSWPRGS